MRTTIGYLKFNKFLAGIDLAKWRDKYRKIKIVELDMPKRVQALACIYEQYWDKRRSWADYDNFYDIYQNALYKELESWRKECQFSKKTFYTGLPARIYRTWASLLTQVQGAYVAESMYGKGTVTMGVSDDHKGKDLVIDFGDFGRWPIQIKKLSQRVEARRGGNREEDFLRVEYEVPNAGPKTKTGKDSVPFQRWHEKWGDKLERLDNGFIVFKPAMFEARNLLKRRGVAE